MRKLLSLLALCTLAAAPARATWTFTGGTDASSSNPIITDGDWTVQLNNKSKVKYSTHPNASVGLLDLTGVEADTGLRITMVDYQGFQLKTDITGIILPESCTSFGEAAFYKASKLETVVLSSQTGPIDKKNVFAICTPLKSVTYHGVEATNGVVCLPPTVTKLANSAFQMWDGNTAITKIIAPGVTTISKYSLYKIYNLQSVEFSPTFSGFDSEGAAYAFTESGKNGSFTISPSKWKYPISNLSGDDIFFNGRVAGELDWSEGTFTEVPYRIFCGDTKLDRVTLPETVTSIKKQAFVDMKKGFVLRFLGGVPTLADSEDSKWQTSFWGSSGRYRIVVDPVAYPEWISADKGFAELTDADRARSDYPSDLPSDEVLGTTTIGLTGSVNSARRHWLIKYVDHTQYPVTWKNGDAVFGTTQGEIGEAVVAPAGTPAKASTAEFDYEFLGWNTDPSAATALDLSALAITGEMTFHAVFSATTRSYTVSWEMDDGTPIDTTTVLYGVAPTHVDASRASTAEYSYVFQGWSTNGTDVLAPPLPVVTGPVTFVAVFERHDASTTATVSWFDEDGTTALNPAQTTVTKGERPAHAEPTKAPTVDTVFTFAGWVEVGSDGSVTNTTASLPAVTADIAYKAAYTASVRRYTVTFANWDGSVVDATDYDYGTAAADVAVPANPTRPATAECTYTFAGWDAEVGDVLGAATYTATYTETANEYAATFVDGVDGSTIEGPTTYAYGAAVTAPEPPEHYGFTFSAWSPAVSTMPAAATTYTAVYTTNKFTITWVNGDATTTAKYDYLTPTNAITVPGGKKTDTTKASYTFLEWSPALEPVQSNTTYTAMFQGTVLSPMTLLYGGTTIGEGAASAAVSATMSNYTAGEEGFSAGVTAAVRNHTQVVDSATGTAAFEAPAVTATFTALSAAKGYDWTIVATQWLATANVADVATLHGRFYAKPTKTWFTAEQAVFENGVFRPTIPSAASQQVRLHATMTFPTIPSRVHPDTTGAVTGIDVWQPNAGWPLAYYAWNGAKWVRLKGAIAKLGEPVELLGVIDFAIRGGTMTWYADGAQLTDEDGNWAIPMSLGPKQIARFVFDSETATLDSLSGDFDLGFNGTMLLIK